MLVDVLLRFLKVKFSLPDLKPWSNTSPRLCPQIISGLECTRQHMGFLFLNVFFRFVWAYTGSLLAVLLLSSHFNFFFFSFYYFSVYSHSLMLTPFFKRRKWHRKNKQLCLAKGEENSIWMPTVCPYFCKRGSWYLERLSNLPQLRSKLCEAVHINIFIHQSPFSMLKACCFYKIIPYFIDTEAIYYEMYH